MAQPFTLQAQKFTGYSDDAQNAASTLLCEPSVNTYIDSSGVAYTRQGYTDTTINLNNANEGHTSFYMRRYNITFFAGGTKVYYVEHDRSDAVVDTGITLTDGTKTRFAEYAGQVVLTNPTDGLRLIVVTRLNGAVSQGAANIITDIDGGARTDRFDTALSPGTKNLRVRGTNEQYASITAATGTFVLSGTASQALSDNDIAIIVYDISSSRPRGSKITFWREQMHVIGHRTGDAAAANDDPASALQFGQIASISTIENIVSFSGGISGYEMVGKGGTITNFLSTRDYMYLWKENETYFIKFSDINATTGARTPQILSTNYGCLNEDCAADLGDGTVAFLTNNNRIIAIKIASDSGAAVVFPDETFDTPIRNTLSLMDTTQTDTFMYYDPASKRLFVQLLIDTERLTLVYDNNIRAWLPPHTNKDFMSYYTKDGILYATERTDDTLFQVDDSYADNGISYESVAASPLFQFQDGRQTCEWKEVELSGGITQSGEIQVENIVNKGTAQVKTIPASDASFDTATSLSTVTIDSATLGGGEPPEEFGDWDKRYGIYPRYGQNYQVILSTNGEGDAFKWYSYLIRGAALRNSLLTLS